MSLQHAWAVTNRLTGVAVTGIVWENAAATNRQFLNDGRMDKVFAVGSTVGGVWVRLDLGAAYPVSAIAVLNTNLRMMTSRTVTIRAADDSTFTTGVVTAKATSAVAGGTAAPKDVVFQFAGLFKRHWEIQFTWPAGASLTLGEIFVGVPVALTRAIVYGHGGKRRYINSRFEGYSGETRGHFIAGPIASRRLPFEALSLTERDEVWAMLDAVKGGSTPMLWCEQYEATATAADAAHQACIFGRLLQDESEWSEEDTGLYSVSALEVRSLAREVGS